MLFGSQRNKQLQNTRSCKGADKSGFSYLICFYANNNFITTKFIVLDMCDLSFIIVALSDLNFIIIV
jgi:hypothetical protein